MQTTKLPIRRLCRGFSFAALVLSGMVFSALASAAPTTIVAKHSGKCLDVAGGPGATGNGALIDEWSCSGEANQAWMLNDTGNGEYQLIAEHSGKCLDVPNGSTANDMRLQQWACAPGDKQLWTLEDMGGGYHAIKSVASGKCVDVYMQSSDGAPVVQWDCHGGDNQLFSLDVPAPPPPPSDETTAVEARHSGKCMEVTGTANGALIEQWTCTGGTNQAWTLDHMGNGQYRFVAENSGKCLDLDGGSTANGVQLQQWDCAPGDKQLWTIEEGTATGYYAIKSVASGKCVDVSGASTSDGGQVIQWDCHGGDNQYWKLTPPPTFEPLVVKHSGKCLDVAGQSTDDGALIQQWVCNGQLNQNWQINDVGNGEVEIIAEHSGKCIEAIGGGTANGTGIQQMPCNGSARQHWTQQSTGTEGEYTFVHVPSDRCLDVTGGPSATGDGVAMQLWDCSGQDNQTWTIGAPTAPPPSGTRDPLQWPFAQDSIWNMPIGSNAQYVAANLSATPGGDEWAPMPAIDPERIVLRPSAPMTTIYYSDAGWSGANRCGATGNGSGGGLPVDVPIPHNYVVPDSNKNESAVFLMPDGRTLVHTQPLARCSAGSSATSIVRFDDVDLYGDGRRGSHGGSGLSAIGGAIRLGELRPGMQGPRHALKIAIYAREALYRCTTFSDCYRWPAFTADSYAVGHYGADNGNSNWAMKMGSLLAIPPSTNIDNLGLETEPGRQLAWTLQNYGAYIVDDAWSPAFYFNAEDGADGSKSVEFQNDYGFPMEQRVRDNTPWTRDVQRLVQALYVVDNNGPNSIGGGGTPRQPLAPPFE